MAKPTDMAKDELKVCVIGGSAGSLEVLLDFLPAVKLDCALVIVLHRRLGDDMMLEELIASRVGFPVLEVNDKTALENGKAYIAPADYHLLFETNGLLSLDISEKVFYSRPSIDVAFTSAAEAFGPNTSGILLSGANQDGALGLNVIRLSGGATAVQDPACAIFPAMPNYALETCADHERLTPSEMADFLSAHAKKD